MKGYTGVSGDRIPMKEIPCAVDLVGASEGKVIYLRRVGSLAKGGELFLIRDTKAEGGSCIFYHAKLIGEGKTGRLKEFYPQASPIHENGFCLTRTEANHVVSVGKDGKPTEDFLKAKKEFIQSYISLRAAMERNEEFSTFIPAFTMYYACDENGEWIENSTAYIWTEAENQVVFGDYLKEIHQKQVNPEETLITILEVMISLTECIKILHTEGLLHLDIKPENFSVRLREKMLTDMVSLFDVNSMYFPMGTRKSFAGTEGFRAPEVIQGEGRSQSDIFSIGCTLLAALTGEGYTCGFGSLQRTVESSPFVAALRGRKKKTLCEKLCCVLQWCLRGSVSHRYQGCENLLTDLRDALACLQPTDPAADRKQMEERLACLYHLYKYPLYEVGADAINVCIIGFDRYAQNFMDCCLQLGQVCGKELNVRVICNGDSVECRERQQYLKDRPSLKSFFRVDGSPCESPYGNIVFEGGQSYRYDLSHKVESPLKEGEYVLLSLGDDKLNQNIAEKFFSLCNGSCFISYICENETKDGRGAVKPLSINANVKKERRFSEIECMAFNVHTVWKDDINVDMISLKKEFRIPYNYLSCISNAISVKYKLYSVGIDKTESAEAASLFRQQVLLADRDRVAWLAEAEHRRWVCEKITDGWTRRKDLGGCIEGPVNDKKRKRHICLVRSRGDRELAHWGRRKWDCADGEQLALLDPLDRVSVELHQAFLENAKAVKKRNIAPSDPSVVRIRRLIGKEPRASVAFFAWISCLSHVWRGGGHANRYTSLKQAFLNTLEGTGIDEKEVRLLVDSVDRRFTPVLKSMEYVDYKQNDYDMIEYIPFVLTNTVYRTGLNAVIPFSAGDATETFGNVVAMSAARPSRITYLHHLDSEEDVVAFVEQAEAVLRHIRVRNINARLYWLLTYRKEIESALPSLESLLKKHTVCLFPVSDREGGLAKLSIEAQKCEKIGAAERNDTELSHRLEKDGFYDIVPWYRLDHKTATFLECHRCDFLYYLKAKPFLRASDMAIPRGVDAVLHHDIEHLLTDVYQPNSILWRSACRLLSAHNRRCENAARFDRLTSGEPICEHRYLVPASAFDSVSAIIDYLVENGLADRRSEIHYYTVDCCEAFLYAARSAKEGFDRLLSDVHILTSPTYILFRKTEYGGEIAFDNLTVTDLRVEGEEGEKICDLLQTMEKRFRYIVGYQRSPEDGSVSFTYASRSIKEMLTRVERVREMYAYRKCMDNNSFDDVECGNDSVSLIVTKGLRSLFVAFQSNETDQAQAEALLLATKRFGIHCKPVLIVDCDATRESLTAQYTDLTVICGTENVKNIAKMLESVLND